MTKAQVVEQFTEYAENNGIPCGFKEDKKGTLMSSFEVTMENLAGYAGKQVFCVYNNGSLSSVLEIDFQIPDSRFLDMEKLVSMINEAEEAIEFRLFKEHGSIAVILSYVWSDKEFFDEELMDAFYNLPYIILQYYSEALLSVIENDSSPEEAFLSVQGSDDNNEETGSTISFGEVRYYFEHKWLREYYYEDTRDIVDGILEEKGNFLYKLMDGLCISKGVEMKYDRSRYKVFHHKTGKDYSIIRIVMPDPEITLNCFEVWLIFSDDYKNRGYFTVEKGEGAKKRFLCSWEDNGLIHRNYGKCGKDNRKIEKDIASIFEAMNKEGYGSDPD